MTESKPFVILSIDGGGIRGLYSATVLTQLAHRFKIDESTLHQKFDLIAGTSTGGILAAGLVAGEPPSRLAALYREKGSEIFSGNPIPKGMFGKIRWLIKHLNRSIHSNDALRLSLSEIFGAQTLGTVFEKNKTALCITAVNILDHTPRVFKTPHCQGFDRDDNISLVDACLATSAAPIYLPLHRTSTRSESSPCVYVDGGLWMNNPTPVALLEALKMTETEQEIIILSIGNPTPAAGSNPSKVKLNRGLAGWQAGLGPLELSMNSQALAAHHSSELLAEQLRRLGRQVSIIRPTIAPVSSEHAQDLSMDNATQESLGLLASLAESDATECYRKVQAGTPEGELLKRIFLN